MVSSANCEMSPDALYSAHKLVWNTFVGNEVFIRRSRDRLWTFSDLSQAEVKADADRLGPESRCLILGTMAMHPCVLQADLLVGVPDGMTRDAAGLAEKLDKQSAQLRRIKNGGRHDYEWVDGAQAEIAADAVSACVLEDISTTGSSAHATALLLREANPYLQIHSLSMLLRGAVQQRYIVTPDSADAVIDQFHALCTRFVPREHDTFVSVIGFEPATVDI